MLEAICQFSATKHVSFMISLRKFTLIALGVASIGSAAAQNLKIATVDMQKLFKDYYRTAEEQKQVNVERARIQKENNERLEAIRAIEEELQKGKKQLEDPSLNEAKKQELFKAFQTKNQEGIALDRERREYLQRRNAALGDKMNQRMKAILEEIRKVVDEQAKGEDFDYVFDRSGTGANGVQLLVYAKDANDITTAVITKLNKDAPAPSADAPAADGATEPAPAEGDKKPE